MYQTLHAALLQMDCVLGDKTKNLTNALSLADQAVSKNADLLVLPELFNTGYELSVIGDRISDYAEDDFSHETVDAMRNYAVSHQIDISFTIPYFHSSKQNKPNISMFYMDKNGKILCIQDKNHLFGDEKKYFALGNDYTVFETRFGRIGMMVCYDANFPEPTRILALQGAQIILSAAAWRAQDIRLFDMIMPQRAAENVCYVLANNRYGIDNGRYNPGHSQICDPDGRIVAFSGEYEDIVYAALNASIVDEARSRIPYLDDLRDAEYPIFIRH
jgi:predicted amidohydrolase